MANGNLHIICGNCGSNDDFEFNIYHDKEIDDVTIICKSCSTFHELSSYAAFMDNILNDVTIVEDS